MEVWEYRCVCDTSVVIQRCASLPLLIQSTLPINRPNRVTIPKFYLFEVQASVKECGFSLEVPICSVPDS